SESGHQFSRRLAPWRAGAERLGHRMPRANAVLVETIAGPGAAEPGVPAPLDVAEAFLGGESGLIILRMLADVFAESQLVSWCERRIEADKQRLVGIDGLQLVHPVGDDDVIGHLILALPAQEIPGGPGASAPWHQAFVAMQVDGVGR